MKGKILSKKDFLNELLLDPETLAYDNDDEEEKYSDAQIKSKHTTDDVIDKIKQPADQFHPNGYNYGYFFEEILKNKEIQDLINTDSKLDEKSETFIKGICSKINKESSEYKIKFIINFLSELNITGFSAKDKASLIKKIISDSNILDEII